MKQNSSKAKLNPIKGNQQEIKGKRKASTTLIQVAAISNSGEVRKSRKESFVSGSEEKEPYTGVNQILVWSHGTEKPIFYVPAYLRMRINRVNQINYLQSKAEIETEIRVWLMIKQFPEVVQKQIINQAIIEINAAEKVPFQDIIQPSKLDASQIKNKSQNAKGFLLSQRMELDIESNAFWSPFQLIKLIANLQIKKIVLGQGNEQFKNDLKEVEGGEQKYFGASVQFNFLDAHPFLQFSFGQVRSLGTFDIAQSLVDMKFSNDNIRDDQDDLQQQEEQLPLNLIGNIIGINKQTQKLQGAKSGQLTPDAYQHGQILIPLYKYPSTTIINVFVPLFMVGIMNLGVFFEGNDMSNRNASLATFLLAYIAFFPTIRQNLPETPKLVFTEILVYIQIACSLLCFFYSLYVNMQPDYVFVWSQVPAFLVCMSITGANMCVVIGMFLTHKIVWERQYNKLPKGSNKYINCKYLNTDDNEEWWNKECDQQFKFYMDLGLVSPFKQKMVKKKPAQVSNPIMGMLDNSLSLDKNHNTTNTNLIQANNNRQAQQ